MALCGPAGNNHAVTLVHSIDAACVSLRLLHSLPRVPDDVNLVQITSQVRTLLHDVRVLQNMTSLAATLPHEILSTIFRIVQWDIYRWELWGAVNPDSRQFTKWTRVLRVCRRWRNVGFSCPPLWATIFAIFRCRTIMPKFTPQACLQRSASCPLTVFLDSWADQTTILKLLLQLPRVRELTFDMQTNGLLTLPLIWARPGPALQVLTLIGGHGQQPNAVPKLFSKTVPYLISLALSQYTTFTVYSMPALRRLHLHRCTMKVIQSVESLVAFLQNVPTLEDLKFTKPLFHPFLVPTQLQPNQRVTLPCLRRLAFVGDGECVRTFLRRLHLFPGVSLTFTCSESFDVTTAIDTFPGEYNELENIHELTDFEIRFSWDNVTTLRAVGKASAFYSQWRDAGPGMLFARIFPPPQRVWLHFCCLTSQSMRDTRSEAVQDFLLRAPGIQTLSVVGDNGDFVDELSTILSPCKDITEIGPQLACRNLWELRICVDRDMSNYATIRDLLLERQEKGCKLRTLRIYHPASFAHMDEDEESLDPGFFCGLKAQGIDVEVIYNDLPEMDWVDICSSPSDGPWDWPVWTRDGGCSDGSYSGFLR